MFRKALLAAAIALTCQSVCFAGDASEPVGEPALEPATLKCLGAYWVIKGDDNKNAVIEVAYRKVGTQDWKAGPPLFRVAKKTNLDKSIQLDENSWLFAGSVIDIPEATEYELKLALNDQDGGKAERILKAHTIAEPTEPAGQTVLHVTPGNGGGVGTKDDPFKGLAAAQKAAKPGTTFLLHAGKYQGQFAVNASGEEGKPIIWRGAGDAGGETIIELDDPTKKQHIIYAPGKHDLWFERLTVQGSSYSDICLHEAYRIVVRRCHLLPELQGIYATRNGDGKMGSFFISDNVIDGKQPWPATAEQWNDPKPDNPNGIEENRGIWVGGSGNVICYNLVHNTKDGIDTEQKQTRECAVDIFNNEVYNCYDDGAEMDGSHRNCRNFNNRYTNTLTGISFQPIHGGPIYVYRNVFYNVKDEFEKLHNDPSGAVVVHNTFIHKGPGLSVSTKSTATNCYSRNNLFIGTEGRAMELDLRTKDLDFDYDGFGGWSGSTFLRYNTTEGKFPFKSPEEVRAKSLIEKHCVIVDPASLFASGLKAPEYKADYQKPAKTQSTIGLTIYEPRIVDVRLNPKSNAVGAAEKLPGFNDPAKPADLGAVPLGAEMPHYGPRPEAK